MHSTPIVARMAPGDHAGVARFGEFDGTDMPHRMGTRRRRLFHHQGPYFHLQDFETADGGERIEAARNDPRSVSISDDLKRLDPEDRRALARGDRLHPVPGAAAHPLLDARPSGLPPLPDGRGALCASAPPEAPRGWNDRITSVRTNGLDSGTLILVRPDGHVCRAGAATAPGLPEALRRWFGVPTQDAP